MREGHTEIATILLEHGANINATNNNGATSLMLASQIGHNETIALLLKHGADVNAKNIMEQHH